MSLRKKLYSLGNLTSTKTTANPYDKYLPRVRKKLYTWGVLVSAVLTLSVTTPAMAENGVNNARYTREIQRIYAEIDTRRAAKKQTKESKLASAKESKSASTLGKDKNLVTVVPATSKSKSDAKRADTLYDPYSRQNLDVVSERR